jgi:hypothetical protein
VPSVPTHLPLPPTPDARRRRNRALALSVLLFLVAAALATWEVTRLAPQGAPAYESSTTGPATLWAWDGAPAGFQPAWQGTQGPNSTQIDLAYDARAGVLLAWDHGCTKIRPGFDGGCQNTTDQTWVYQGGAWHTENPPASPTASGAGVLVDDGHLGRVLYVNAQAQVWAWTGHTWQPVAREDAPRIPAPGAPTRQPQQAFAAGYDQATGDLVVARSERTWLWDGSRWSSRAGGIDVTDQGSGAQLIDDVARGAMVYAGRHQTWTWGGETWRHVPHTALPSGSLAYDPVTQRTVLVAPEDTDCSKGGCLTTTWTWDGSAWTSSALSSSARIPTTRYSSTPPPVTYDGELGGLILLVSAN